MTTLHKLTLGGIAAVCVLVIAVNLGTSKGPSAGDTPPAVVIENGGAATTSATPTTPATPARPNPGDGTPVVLGPRLTEARGLEDLVSEIREVTGDGDSPASEHSPATTQRNTYSSDGIASTPSDPVSFQGSDLARVDHGSPNRVVPPTGTSSSLADGADTLTGQTPAAEVTAIEPQTLTLGPAPKPLTEEPPAVTEEDYSAFADIPVENELPPALDQTSETETDTIQSEESPSPSEIARKGYTSAEYEALFKSEDVPADPPGTVAPIVSSSPVDSIKANEPARVIAPPPAKANEPALAQKEAPKVSVPVQDDPAIKTEPAKPAIGSDNTYTIQPGDTYSSIAIVVYGAERHWLEIADANPEVDPKRLKVGQVIKLPGLGADSPETNTASKPDASASSSAAATASTVKAPGIDKKIHEVKAGENLSSISRKYFDTPDHWRHIYVTNRQTIGSDPGKLQAGIKLKITQPSAD